jgi:hypothetical protein
MANSDPLQNKADSSGVAYAARAHFHVPATPTIRRDEVLEALRSALDRRGIRGGRIELSDEVVHRGKLIDATGQRVEFPPGESFRRAHVALVDMKPDCRWAHEALWAFIPAEGGEVELRPTTVPENQGGAVRLLPEVW